MVDCQEPYVEIDPVVNSTPLLGPFIEQLVISLLREYKMSAIEKFKLVMGCELHGHPQFYALLMKMADLHSRKNSNYAKEGSPLSNLRRCELIGIPAWKGVVVRLQDKFSRIENLANGVPDRVGESLEDTLLDNAVYSLLALILLSEMVSQRDEDRGFA